GASGEEDDLHDLTVRQAVQLIPDVCPEGSVGTGVDVPDARVRAALEEDLRRPFISIEPRDGGNAPQGRLATGNGSGPRNCIEATTTAIFDIVLSVLGRGAKARPADRDRPGDIGGRSRSAGGSQPN